MFFMWLTSKAQTLLIIVLLGLYSLNSFSATLNLVSNGDEKSYKSAQFELLSEKLSFSKTDPMQILLASSLNEFVTELNKEGRQLELDTLLKLSGNIPLPFNKSYEKYSGNNYQFYLDHFNTLDRSNFRVSFYQYYFDNIDSFKSLNVQSEDIFEYKDLTFNELEKVILKDLYLTFNDVVNELLDRKGIKGLNPVKLPRDVFNKTFGIINDKDIQVLSEYLSPYTFEMRKELLRPSTINENKHYQGLRGILGDFNHSQFFTLIFHKFKDESKVDFKELMSSLKSKVNLEFEDFNNNFLVPKLMNDQISSVFSDYVRSPSTKLESTHFVAAIICGLNKNIKSQVFNKDVTLINYCHFNNVQSAYLMKDSDTLIRLRGRSKTTLYPKLANLLKRYRTISSTQNQ